MAGDSRRNGLWENPSAGRIRKKFQRATSPREAARNGCSIGFAGATAAIPPASFSGFFPLALVCQRSTISAMMFSRGTLVLLVTLACSCAQSKSASPAMSHELRTVLSAEQAATLAAKLANDECERLYKRRPFVPEQYEAGFAEGLYHWGHLDVGAPAGLSAEVWFKPDGSDPHVNVWFSTDAVQPQQSPKPPPVYQLP
jgi:hypothetical protein